jgi:hypothetical protein
MVSTDYNDNDAVPVEFRSIVCERHRPAFVTKWALTMTTT